MTDLHPKSLSLVRIWTPVDTAANLSSCAFIRAPIIHWGIRCSKTSSAPVLCRWIRTSPNDVALSILQINLSGARVSGRGSPMNYRPLLESIHVAALPDDCALMMMLAASVRDCYFQRSCSRNLLLERTSVVMRVLERCWKSLKCRYKWVVTALLTSFHQELQFILQSGLEGTHASHIVGSIERMA